MIRAICVFIYFCAHGAYGGEEIAVSNDDTGIVKKTRSVTITVNGGWESNISGHESPELCKKFILKTDDVMEFFRYAELVLERRYEHDLPAAMCYAEGEISFLDGEQGKWNIDQARRGFLTTKHGTRYFYCDKCRAKNFAPANGE